MIKKAIELSKICDQYIYMVIFDEEKQRLVEYSSDPKFNRNVVNKITDPKKQDKMLWKESYTNDHFIYFLKNRNEVDEDLEYLD